MSAGQVRVAIREMLVLPHRRAARGLPGPVRWAWWQWALALVSFAWIPRLVGRLWTWLLLVAGLGLGFGMLPLFGVLGYELAFAMALVAAPLGLDLGAALARQLQRMPPRGIERASYAGRALASSTVAAAGLAAAVMVIPAVICALRGIVIPTCDWWFGIEAYLAMPIVTALLAGALGHVLGVVAGPRRFAGAALAQLPLVLVAVMALWRFYGAPPVFTYNAILGYFPGNLYDENVQLTAALAWSRLEQLGWVIAIAAAVTFWLDVPRYRTARAARPVGRRLGALGLALVAAAGSAVLHHQGGALGYCIDAEDIEEALGGRFETPHFIIHYSDTKELREVIGLVAEDHEFRYAQVVKQLGVEPVGKLRSFYFAGRDEKARWMGARDVEMAKPWRGEIYLDHRAFPHGSLRHEIAHAVAAEFGDPLFGVAARRVLGLPLLASPGLIEGLAVAIDWPGGYDRMTPHESVRALTAMGKRPSIAQLLTLQFFSVSSATGYTTAGSFLRFLLDTYGAPKLREMYRSGGEFADAYGKPLARLEAEWLAMIDKIQLPKAAVDASRERFRGTSVFDRPCPHAIAKQRELAGEAGAAGDRARAIWLMRDVCSDAPEEPRYQMDLADLLFGGNPLERAEALGRWTSVARNEEGVTSTVRAEAFEKLAKAAAVVGNDAAVRALIAEAVQLPVDSNERRQLDALAFSLGYPGAAGPALRGYFFNTTSRVDPETWALLATLAEPELGFAHYLHGLQLLGNGELTAASAELQRALVLGLPGVQFVRNAGRRLAVAAYRANDPAGLAAAIAALQGPGMTETDRLLATDWAERRAFDAR